MPIRLAIHAGPHKTGSTSIQAALDASRDLLASHGVLYPQSLPAARWPAQHADAWLLLRDRRRKREFHAWLAGCHDQARQRNCETVLLSSENFHVEATRPELASALRHWQRTTGGDTRLIYVQRDPVSHACSRAISHLSGETGFFFRQRYDLRRWAQSFTLLQEANQRACARLGAHFLPLDGAPSEALAARVVELASGKQVPGLASGFGNVTSEKLADPDRMLSYGLRVMHSIVHDTPVTDATAFLAARGIAHPQLVDPAAFGRLVADFQSAVRQQVEAGVADALRLGPWARRIGSWRARREERLQARIWE